MVSDSAAVPWGAKPLPARTTASPGRSHVPESAALRRVGWRPGPCLAWARGRGSAVSTAAPGTAAGSCTDRVLAESLPVASRGFLDSLRQTGPFHLHWLELFTVSCTQRGLGSLVGLLRWPSRGLGRASHPRPEAPKPLPLPPRPRGLVRPPPASPAKPGTSVPAFASEGVISIQQSSNLSLKRLCHFL